MTRSPKALIPAVLAILAVGAFYLMLLSPKRADAARLDEEIAAKQAQLEQSRALGVTYEKARANYKTNYTTVARLGKAVPADDDVRSLLVQIDDAADRANVDFHSIAIGAATATTEEGPATTGLAPPPGTVPVGSAGFSTMPFSFGFEGSFVRLSNFFDRLEDFVTVTNKDVDVTGRLLLLGSISITPKTDLKHLTAQVGAASYLVPAAQGLEGETPGAVGGAQGAAPPAGTSVPPPTSATITGAR